MCVNIQCLKMPSLKLTVENQISNTLQRKGYRLGRNMAEGSYCKVKLFVRCPHTPFPLYNDNSLTSEALSQYSMIFQLLALNPSPLLTNIGNARVLSALTGERTRFVEAICVFDILQLAYKTYDSGYTKKVACKVVNRGTASQEFVSKFLPRELSIIRSIRHPHIVNLLDIVDMHGTVYIFMDLCEKGDLLEFIRDRGPLPESRARHYARPAPLQLFGEQIRWANSAKYLGLLLDIKLTWQLHCTERLNKARQRLRILGPLLNKRSGLSTRNGLTLILAKCNNSSVLGSETTWCDQLVGQSESGYPTRLCHMFERAIKLSYVTKEQYYFNPLPTITLPPPTTHVAGTSFCSTVTHVPETSSCSTTTHVAGT
uniref:Protein kinase domain-containing protein n=1 Tax=Timema shepardi TaxID=629360 RepID=A0A7R9FWP6_TIMSH|nr:unnamed protein product [Timema shepardi]